MAPSDFSQDFEKRATGRTKDAADAEFLDAILRQKT